MIRIAALLTVSIFAALMATGRVAHAGEVGGGIASCDLSNPYLGCEWKSKGCYKPSKPFILASSVSAYNRAVDEFNDYLAGLQRYEDCVLADGKADVGDRFKAIVVKGAQKELDDADNDLRSARSDLDLAKSRVH